MVKKKTSAPPVTEPKPIKSESKQAEPVEPEVIEPTTEKPEQQPPEPQIKLTPEQRIEKLETDVTAAFKALIDRLGPIIQLSDQLAQRQAQQGQGQPQGAPAAAVAGGGDLMQLVQLFNALSGGAGGGDDPFKQMAMKSFEADIQFSRDFRKLFLSKFAGQTVSDMAKATTET